MAPPVVDLHSDLLLDVEARRVRGERDVFRRQHLPALEAAGIRVQVLAVFVETAFVPDGALRRALALIESALHEEAESEGALRLVGSAAELDAALEDGAVAGILALEGAEPLGRDPGLVRVLARLGVRMIGPTWNRANDFADGLGEDRGVGFTALGRRLLAELEEAGVALDLSHLSPRAVEIALDAFGGRVLASHANAHAVYPSERNLPAGVLQALAERDGVCGLNALRVFLGPGDPIERLVEHHAALTAAGGPRLPAMGCDFTGFLPSGPAEAPELGLPPGADRSLAVPPLHPDRETVYGDLAQALRDGGATDADVDATMGGNALRFLRRSLG